MGAAADMKGVALRVPHFHAACSTWGLLPGQLETAPSFLPDWLERYWVHASCSRSTHSDAAEVLDRR